MADVWPAVKTIRRGCSLSALPGGNIEGRERRCARLPQKGGRIDLSGPPGTGRTAFMQPRPRCYLVIHFLPIALT